MLFRDRFRRTLLACVCLPLVGTAGPIAAHTGAYGPAQLVSARQATPAVYSCATDVDATPAATPAMGDMLSEHDAGTTAPDFDQTYIDMMLPHHASVIALAEAALPRLENVELQMIAMNIIASQTTELAELTSLRQQFYGSPTPEPMDSVMDTMATTMPEAHDLMMADMAMMDSDALVAEFCARGDADLAFIDLVIPHHQSAIVASRTALSQATHPEIREFSGGVIVAQQAEIDQMTSIRSGLAATPAT